MRTRRRSRAPILLLSGACLIFPACGPAPRVVQGTVLRYDAVGKVVSLRDEMPPRPTIEISVAGAEIGADPVPGDTLRVAYRVVGDRPVATRVMNLTRQEELARQGGGSAGEH
jgi:hypothetical protein